MSEFKVGDRVRLNQQYHGVREGATGTVEHIADAHNQIKATYLLSVRLDEPDGKGMSYTELFDYRVDLIHEVVAGNAAEEFFQATQAYKDAVVRMREAGYHVEVSVKTTMNIDL